MIYIDNGTPCKIKGINEVQLQMHDQQFDRCSVCSENQEPFLIRIPVDKGLHISLAIKV